MNASHELQTPLAIVRGKVELLAESDRLTEQQMKELDEIYATLGRAVKLNKSLLLLSRIANGQYTESEDVSVDEILENLLPDLMDIYEHKQVRLQRKQGEHPFIIRCNHSLAQILVSNLVKNALLHNEEEGELQILTTPVSLTLKNTGDFFLVGVFVDAPELTIQEVREQILEAHHMEKGRRLLQDYDFVMDRAAEAEELGANNRPSTLEKLASLVGAKEKCDVPECNPVGCRKARDAHEL